jgi:hypothetical protein
VPNNTALFILVKVKKAKAVPVYLESDVGSVKSGG